MITTNYRVSGMTCGHCVKGVTEEVQAIPGVTDVKVEQAGPMSVVSEAQIDFSAIDAAVKEAGDYEVALA
ncbi:MAG: cation transporter [Brooklawnia sp.]|uniref:heavy-metal-associated domain-containing protein n=1 Tax=Brooklawnia sp. TaxID=2699740 RepID=UPI003C76E1BA